MKITLKDGSVKEYAEAKSIIDGYFENIFEEPYMMATFWILAAMMIYLGIYRNRKA